MNRGSAFNQVPQDWTYLGFNEAPIHESGKLPCPRSSPARSRCFNEAPIHESGKCAGPWQKRVGLACFNEAPIHESGK